MTDTRPAVLLDVDGTLVDANYFHTVSWWQGLRDLGEDVPMSRIHPLIGMGTDQLVERLLAKELKGASDAHARHYEDFKDQLQPLPGAADLLRELKRRGARVVLGTSSKEEDVPRLTEVIGAEDAVDHVVSKGDVERSKPEPDIFAVAVEQAELDSDRTIVVGDTPWDVEAASKIGLDTVCVLTGGHTREKLEEAGAVAVYEDAADLLDHFDDSPIAKLLG